MLVVLFVMVCLFVIPQVHRRESTRRVACVGNLRRLGLVLNLYANENHGKFPPLDDRPGNLMVEGSAIYPEYLSDVNLLGCPADRGFDPKRSFRVGSNSERRWYAGLRPRDPHPDCIDSTSYGYTGYVLLTDAHVNAFAYALDTLRTQLEWSNNALGGVGRPTNAWRDDDLNMAALGYTETLWPEEHWGQEESGGLIVHPDRPEEVLNRLGLGGPHRWYQPEPPEPSNLCLDSSSAGSVAVLWDQISTDIIEFSHVPAGQNVLYFDGHVEYHRYTRSNTRFPTSPTFAAYNWAIHPAQGGPEVPWGDCP